VVAAGRHGVTHGCLHPDEVLVPADGQPRLTGLELTSALHACTATPDAAASAYDDTRALGALLYACLTGRWPLPGWGGLPSPVRGDGAHPRQQRGGVSRELDDITARAVSGGYDSPAALAGDLASLPMSPLHPAPADPAEIGDRRWRRVAWWVVPPVLVAAIGFGAWTLGSDLGRVPSPARAAVAHLPQPHRHSGGGTHRLVWSKPPQVTSFDPQGDGTEDPGGVGLAVDDDPSTQWTTDIYHDSPQFGGLKRGVGLLLDLGRPKQVSTAELLLSEPGASLQIRAGDSPPQRPTDLPLVVARSDTPATAHLRLTTTVRARYWLVWFTTLPATGSDYQIGVGEIALQH
jgi:hypothetical protein